VNGSIITWKEREFINGRMEEYLMVILKTIKNMAMEFIHGLIELSVKY